MSLTHPNPTTTTAWAGAASVLAAGAGTYALSLRNQLAQARKDPLTGLFARDEWQRRAQPIIERSGVVIMIDLDRFKVINDTYGHAAGDRVLKASAVRLAHWCEHDVAAAGRLGGDEFAVALLIPEHRLSARITELRQVLAEPVPDLDVAVSASIGWVRAPALPVDLNALLEQADTAMYAVKAASRGGPPHQEAATGTGRRRWSWRGTRRQDPTRQPWPNPWSGPSTALGACDVQLGKGTRPGGDVLPPVPDWSVPDGSFHWWKGGR